MEERITLQYRDIGDPFSFHHTITPARSDDYCIGPEAHRQYEFLYLISGTLTYLIEGRSYVVTPGDMILIAPNDIHTLLIGGNADYDRIVFHFDLELLIQAFRNLETEPIHFNWNSSFPVIPAAICREYHLDELFLSIVENQEKSRYESYHIISRTMDLVVSLDKMFSNRELTLLMPSSVDPLIQRMIDFINDHVTQQVSLDDMAAQLYVSKSTLCHRFRAYMNMTINRYITVKKIYYAAELIQQGMSAVEAGQSVGYSNYTTFFYNYKQIIGTSPSDRKPTELT